MFKRKLLTVAAMATCVQTGFAQTTSPEAAPSASSNAQQIERVIVTGSAIKRIDGETSVPVTVVKMSDLRNAGVTSVEQILSSLSAVQSSVNSAQSIGSGTGGATFADLRGIGPDKTLVLLNGERIANNAVAASAPDLNMIPFAAIERIEVLRDGASALYGTDAIGGVINFITKKSYGGATVTLGYDRPRHAGGRARNASIGLGFGDLASQGFNVLGSFSVKNEDAIEGDQRDFNKRIPGGLSNSTDPANYRQDFPLHNPAAPTCSGTALIPVDGGTQCKLVTSNFVDFAPKADTASGFIKGTLRVNDSLELGAEAFLTRNKVTARVAPVPYGGYLMNPTMPDGQPNPYYPKTNVSPTFDDGTAGAPAFNPSAAFPHPVDVQPGFVYVYWRDFPNGSRDQLNDNKQRRLVLSAEGNAASWDYAVKFSTNKSTVDQTLTGGFADGDVIGEGLLEGIINPFGPQSAAGTALLEKAALTGLLTTSTGKVRILKASVSRELGDWMDAGHAAQIAIGLERRHEAFDSHPIRDFARLVSVSTGVDPDSTAKGERDVTALYSELNVPVLKTLELTGSLRYDKYSDFGSSTNPKVSFRFQPSREMLFRGSASTGFRAPTLFELYSSPAFTNTAGSLNNPVNCPGGTPIAGASAGANCATQFQVLIGGNAALRPEKARNYTVGAVFEPSAELSLGVDLWAIKIKNKISVIPQTSLFLNYSHFQQYFHFAQPGNLLSITSNCPGPQCGYVETFNQNLGDINTNGVDLSGQYRTRTRLGQVDVALSSTFVNKYEYQDYVGGPFNQNVGIYSGAGPIFRWQHNLTAGWTYDTLAAGVAVHYKSGYVDFLPSNHVSAFTTTDLYASWSPIKGASIVAGVRNLFDRDPPFTNQADIFQAGGWDSRYANAAGRTYYVRGTYSF